MTYTRLCLLGGYGIIRIREEPDNQYDHALEKEGCNFRASTIAFSFSSC